MAKKNDAPKNEETAAVAPAEAPAENNSVTDLSLRFPPELEITDPVVAAIAELGLVENLSASMAPLAPRHAEDTGLFLPEDGSGTQRRLPIVGVIQPSTQTRPSDGKIGQYFTDGQLLIGDEIRFFILAAGQGRLCFSDQGWMCRSADRVHSSRGVRCEICPEKPQFVRDSGDIKKIGECDDTLDMLLISEDFKMLGQYTLKGKACSHAQKMVLRFLRTGPRPYHQAYRGYAQETRSQLGTYQSQFVEVALDKNDEPRKPNTKETVILEFLFQKAIDWFKADRVELKRVTESAEKAGGGQVGGDGPTRASYGAGGDVSSAEPDTNLGTGDDSETGEPNEKTANPDDYAGEL